MYSDKSVQKCILIILKRTIGVNENEQTEKANLYHGYVFGED